jgi:LmbE family N-acetylglucosaminyl deacetylase
MKPGCRLLVISPHLDDAVFACGRVIASFEGAIVATVFAGAPKSYEVLTPWDRACGFEPGMDVVAIRREEDRLALSLLGAQPRWLSFLDSQYGKTPSAIEIAQALESVLLATSAETVLFPLGLFHSDHLVTHCAARMVMNLHPEREWYGYEDSLYRTIPGALSERVSSMAALHPCVAVLPVAPHAEQRKREAVACYRSQLRALATPGRLGHADAYEPEGYWTLSA